MARKRSSVTGGTTVTVRHPDDTEDVYVCGENDVYLAANDGKRTLMLISADPTFVASVIAKTVQNNPDHRPMFAAAVMYGIKGPFKPDKEPSKSRLKSR